VDLRKIKKLIELLEESALIEMEITEGDNTIRLSRAGRPAPATIPHEHAVAVGPAIGETPPTEQTGSLADEFPGGTVVESPMVGTYYNAPSPEADPFVEVGSTVQAGQTLCIVEAMKTFNQIESESEGVIRVIYKNNGDPVEYGEPLFLIG